MSTASHNILRGAARALAGIGAGAVVTGIATIAGAQTLPPAIASADAARLGPSPDLTLYLQSSERSHQAAALDRANRAPIGSAVGWTDTYTRASGRVVPLRDYVGFGGARCRDYQVIVDVPTRYVMIWTGSYNTYNNCAVTREMPERVSPAFTREFIAQACQAPVSLASAGR
jgi:surface antigen